MRNPAARSRPRLRSRKSRSSCSSASGSPGIFNAEWTAEKPGTYTVEISAKRADEDVGRDTLMFQRIDGVAENFRTEQNRDLLVEVGVELHPPLLYEYAAEMLCRVERIA